FAWNDSDPRRAAAWASGFPEGNLRVNALKEIAEAWAQHDPPAAERWLVALPHGPSLDAAIGAFVKHIASSDPSAAATWAEKIEDASTRIVQLDWVGRSWLQVDEAAARDWISSSSLPEEMKAQLLDSRR